MQDNPSVLWYCYQWGPANLKDIHIKTENHALNKKTVKNLKQLVMLKKKTVKTLKLQ